MARKLSKPWWLFIGIAVILGIAFSVNQIFLGPLIVHEYTYYYSLLGLFVGCSFLLFPAWKGAARDRVPWYDILLALLMWGATGYMGMHGFEIVDESWVYTGPIESVILSVVLWFISLEALRRVGGLPFAYSPLFKN